MVEVGFRASVIALVVAMGPSTGCEAEVVDEPGPTEARTFYVNTGWGCHTCGFKNSPYLGKHPLTEFSLGNKPFSDQFTLLAIEDPGGSRHKVGFDGDRVQAHTSSGVVDGPGLVDWSLVFVRDKVEQPVKIVAWAEHPDWVDGAPIDTYALGYHESGADGPLVNVCPGLSLDDTTIVFIPGETYDEATKTVSPGMHDSVTVACRGHAVAKLKFLGHDPNDSYGSASENRQAALKMLTADYCGDGVSWTTVGQPLEWADELGLFSLTWSPAQHDLEARWNENGAVCLNEPRNAAYGHDDIPCKLAWCAGAADDLAGERWASYHAP